MGLDMMLTKKVFLYNPGGTLNIFDGDLKIEGVENLSELVFSVMTWRKNAAIHRWFVEHVQNGEDDCGTYFVSHDDLSELAETLAECVGRIQISKPVGRSTHRILTPEGMTEEEVFTYSPDIIDDILPFASGPFFGQAKVDEWFVRDLEETLFKLNDELNKPSGNFFYEYHSSW